MSTFARLQHRSVDLEQSIAVLAYTIEYVKINHVLRHSAQEEVSSLALLEQELEIKRRELASVRAELGS